MYCQECGNKINNEAKFCDKCGNKIEQKLESDSKKIKNYSDIGSATYNFAKVKQLGAINIVIIKSKVELRENELLIESRKDYLGFIKGKIKKENIKLEDISYVINKKSIDMIDGIYAILFLILALIFVNPALLLVTVVCLWTGYGEKIFINTKKNQKLIIHTSGGESTKQLVDLINL